MAKVTLKQFKEILNDAGMELDYAAILIQLERLAWLEKREFEGLGLEHGARFEAKRADAIHEGLTAAGIYDGLDDQAV